MENRDNLYNYESAPSCNRPKNETSSSHLYSAVTHPSALFRNKEDVFKRLRSGKDILCQLPTRIDPNIQFSDDEEEEEISKNADDENNVLDVVKPPELPSKSNEIFEAKNKIIRYEQRKTINSTPWKPIRSYPVSACKPLATRGAMNIQSLLPQSENKVIRSTKVVPEAQKLMKINLMSQPEFKTPMEKPLSSSAGSIKALPALTNETIEVNGKSYSVLSMLGSGGSCKVYSVFDPEKKSLVAVKCVELKNTDPSIREGYQKEIEYLKQLQNSNRVITMYDYEYRQDNLFIVLERGDIDFAKYISKEAKLKRLSPLMIKFYWGQMLETVADIHKYGIVHSDLKPANFLLVAGDLKLIDFGIATSVPEDKTSTFRDTQVGTVNYMSPEAITQMSTTDTKHAVFKVGVKSDVWSLGCILYQLVYGYTPFHSLKNLMQKIHAITSPKYEIVFKPLPDRLLLDVMKRCLKRDPKERASVEELLRHRYLVEDKPQSQGSPKQNSQLNDVMTQMQGLTPRRMSYITKMVQELSVNKTK